MADAAGSLPGGFRPQVRRTRLLEGAASAEGVAVIIDVFRAFSLCAYAAALGARPLVAVAEADRALKLRRRWPRAVLSGESGGWPLPGFDLGNSPSELLRQAASGLNLRGRPFVQRTSAGTQGVMAASRARQLFVASLVNAAATAAVMRSLRPELVTLVAMGNAGRSVAEEDEACAEALEAYLTDRPWKAEQVLADLVQTRRVQDLLAHRLEPFWPSDVALCLAVNLFPFALHARRAGELAIIRPVPAPVGPPRPDGRPRPPARG